jgi:hypothetical protein
MRHLLCLLMLMTAVSGISAVYAQHTRVRAVASYDARLTMIGVYKMSDPEEVSGCDRFILVGRVVSVAYDERSEIVTFSLKARNGESRRVNLPKSLYAQLPSEAERGLQKLLSRGKRIRVVAYGCSVGVLEADEIRAL